MNNNEVVLSGQSQTAEERHCFDSYFIKLTKIYLNSGAKTFYALIYASVHSVPMFQQYFQVEMNVQNFRMTGFFSRNQMFLNMNLRKGANLGKDFVKATEKSPLLLVL